MNEKQQNSEQTEKLSMVDCFLISMFSPREYGKLIRVTTGRVTLYVALLTLLISVIQYAIPVMSAVAAMGGMKKMIINELPDFNLDKGKFSLSEKYERTDEQSGIYILVDTGVDKFTKDDVDPNFLETILVSSSNMLVYNSIPGLGGMEQETKFSDYKDLHIDNQTVADMSGLIYSGMFAVFCFMWIFTLLKHLLVALFYALVMMFLVQSMTANASFAKNYKVALFAQSIGAVVLAITYCIGSSLFIMAGSIFNVFLTIAIMNRALILNEREGL